MCILLLTGQLDVYCMNCAPWNMHLMDRVWWLSCIKLSKEIHQTCQIDTLSNLITLWNCEYIHIHLVSPPVSLCISLFLIIYARIWLFHFCKNNTEKISITFFIIIVLYRQYFELNSFMLFYTTTIFPQYASEGSR